MNSDKSCTLDTVHAAIRRGDTGYVQKAIDAGFDPNTQDLKQCTPLIFAAEFQHPAIVRLLLTHGADPLHKESNGYDASNVAAWHGEWRMGAYGEAETASHALWVAGDRGKKRLIYFWRDLSHLGALPPKRKTQACAKD